MSIMPEVIISTAYSSRQIAEGEVTRYMARIIGEKHGDACALADHKLVSRLWGDLEAEAATMILYEHIGPLRRAKLAIIFLPHDVDEVEQELLLAHEKVHAILCIAPRNNLMYEVWDVFDEAAATLYGWLFDKWITLRAHMGWGYHFEAHSMKGNWKL